MQSRGFMDLDRINKAIKALYDSIDSSGLTDGEKKTLKILIEKIIVYYSNKYKEIQETSGTHDYNSRMARLVCRMTDYIVVINDTINGRNDVGQIVNMIYKEINYNPQKGHFKRKRLI